MKKFTLKHIIMAFIIGALVMVSGQSLANTVSQIGNKVDSEASVYVNGEKVSDAIIIKGKSYVPGRDVAEALGAKVEWKGSQGVMITSGFNFTTEEEISEHNAKIIEYNKNYARITSLITGTEESIKNRQLSLENFKIEREKGVNVIYFDRLIDEYETEIEKLNEELTQYEKELAELEASK